LKTDTGSLILDMTSTSF